jgi:pimeloyl-ACP methyl ester carboxylesterase
MSEPRFPKLPDPVSGTRIDLNSSAGKIAVYSSAGDQAAVPLLLIHSINATPSAYEVKPLYDYYAGKRPVYALELPGFGHSDRSDRKYTIRMMTDAIHAAVDEIRRDHDGPVDALALSLSAEFLARAALEQPGSFRSLALISPTGFERKARDAASGGNLGQAWLRSALDLPLWSRGFFNLLTSRKVIRFFLQKTWGSKLIDEGLWNYAYLTTHQPGARHAPYYFVGGYLFSKDALRLYESLTLPVWMAHGVRGDFTDYRHKDRIAGRANWTVEVFPSGAFPHFEMLGDVTRSYERFLAKHEKVADDASRRDPVDAI